jgi:hypothetical protein
MTRRLIALALVLVFLMAGAPASAKKQRPGKRDPAAASIAPRSGISAAALTSRHVAVSWGTDTPTFAQLELSLEPFKGSAPEGTVFPSAALSSTGYTRVASRTHDLCPTDLTPATLYHVRTRNRDAKGLVTVSEPFTVRTLPAPTPVPEAAFARRDWMGLYATDQWMGNKKIRDNLLKASYIRGASVSDPWSDVEPAPGRFHWEVIDQALAELQPSGKFVKLALRGAAKLKGRRSPRWIIEGVETIESPNGDEKSVKWDPVYACRWWQFVTAFGHRYDERLQGRLAYVGVSGAGSGEMRTVGKTLDAYRRLGYSDAQIEANMLWVWRNMLQVFAEAFPHARLGIVPGPIPLVGTKKAVQRDLGPEVVRSAHQTYGRRLVLSHSGFAVQKTGVLISTQQQYKGQVWIGGLTEQPTKDKKDPVAVLRELFDRIVFPEGYAYVTLHSDGLGINPNRWGDHKPLKDYLNEVEKRFAALRNQP